MRAAGRWGRGSLARELALARVNAITPGLMDTPLLHTAYGLERDTIVQNRAIVLLEDAWVPLRRWRR